MTKVNYIFTPSEILEHMRDNNESILSLLESLPIKEREAKLEQVKAINPFVYSVYMNPNRKRYLQMYKKGK